MNNRIDGSFLRKNILQNIAIGIIPFDEINSGQQALLPEKDYEICVYDEGFIAALLESFSGQKFKVKEIDCWCTGDRTCRFKADAVRE